MIVWFFLGMLVLWVIVAYNGLIRLRLRAQLKGL